MMANRTCRLRASSALAGLVLAAAVAGGCAAGRAPEPSREAVLQRILPSSVQVVVEQQEGRRIRTGSGVAIALSGERSVDCFVLTAGHTLSGQSERRQVFVVFGRDRGRYEKTRAAVVAHRDTPDLDLAVLRTESRQCDPAEVGGPPLLGTPVWVVGFPWGKSMTLASGIVSQVDSPIPLEQEEASRLMVDASVSYGISGGPVFDARSGRLIGIVEGYNTARVTPPGAGWHIDVPVPGQTFVTPLNDIRRFLTDEGLGALLDRSRPENGSPVGVFAKP